MQNQIGTCYYMKGLFLQAARFSFQEGNKLYFLVSKTYSVPVKISAPHNEGQGRHIPNLTSRNML